ncbi:MAG TPA: hypothetical protein DDX84_03295 [Nitrospiraceae bacterium]|nr:hypothetical protein [Nitrospiraceae bacterium]
MRFIVLGAGLSGLTCAAALKRYGHEVTVIEKEHEVGGLARSFRINGYTFDYGPHFLFGEKVYKSIQEHYPEIEFKMLQSTKEKMFFRNKYFNFPFDPKNILRKMERGKVPVVILEMAVKKLLGKKPSNDSENIEDWVIQAVGRQIYNYISLGGYIKKLYGLPPTDISHEWGIQKLKFLAKWRDTNLIQLVSKSFSEGGNVKKRVIHYPGTGIDDLPRKISETLQHTGGRVLFNSEAVNLQHRNDVVSITLRRHSKEDRIDGDFVISTIPITQLATILSPQPPAEIVKKVTTMRYRTLLLLYLLINKERVLDHQCIYFTEDQFFFRRITEFRHLDPSMVPAGKTSLCVEITCFEEEDISHWGKEDLSRIVIEQLEHLGYIRRSDIEMIHLLRIPYAYPVYEVHADKILAQVLAFLESYTRLVSIGRQGLFHYNAMNSSILSGDELGVRLSTSNPQEWKKIIQETYGSRIEKYNQKTREVLT